MPVASVSSQPSRMPRHALCIALVVLVWLALYVPGIWSPPLLDDADSVHAEAAREMMLRHDWSTLYVNGLRYLEKAPLLYWGMAASYEVFGATDWAARLPLALGVLALLLATYAIGRHHFDAAAGLYAALALGLSFGPYIYTRILIPDILVALWLTLGLHCFLVGLAPADGAASIAAYPPQAIAPYPSSSRAHRGSPAGDWPSPPRSTCSPRG